jgi:hypothetical protein
MVAAKKSRRDRAEARRRRQEREEDLDAEVTPRARARQALRAGRNADPEDVVRASRLRRQMALGRLVAGAPQDRMREARMRKNVFLVRAIELGYYKHRLWQPGEEFKMGIDPTIQPPRWVAPIDRPGGHVLGTFVKLKKGKELAIVPVEGLDEDDDEEEFETPKIRTPRKAKLNEAEDPFVTVRRKRRAIEEDEDEEEDEE